MNTKLTLSLDDKVIERAKKYAARNGDSLSRIVERYFALLVKTHTAKDLLISPEIKELTGIIDIPYDLDIKKELAERRDRKYGL